jgi:hypothetical protein
MDPGLEMLQGMGLEQQERPEQRQNQEEDCFHSEGDDNFKVPA